MREYREGTNWASIGAVAIIMLGLLIALALLVAS